MTVVKKYELFRHICQMEQILAILTYISDYPDFMESISKIIGHIFYAKFMLSKVNGIHMSSSGWF